MRMWMVDPRIMCVQHLMGEHRELHALVGALRKGLNGSLQGLAKAGCIETGSIYLRHEELVVEMERRGYTGHKTPMELADVAAYTIDPIGKVDRAASLQLLVGRCQLCNTLWQLAYPPDWKEPR